MIEIGRLRALLANDDVLRSEHAIRRCAERGISMTDLAVAIDNGRIIEQYEDDLPFPSCLLLGVASNGRPIHIVMSDEGHDALIITAYWPSYDKWEHGYIVRKKGY